MIRILLLAALLTGCSDPGMTEAERKAGLSEYLDNQLIAVEAAFERVSNEKFTSAEFDEYLLNFIVPITTIENEDGSTFESLLLSSDELTKECKIYSPNAEVGAAIIPCDNRVLLLTIANGEYYNKSRALPRSGQMAMYLARTVKLPSEHGFDNREYVLLADWPI